MTTLDGRLHALLAPRGADSKRMFGGTCFLVNGNMVVGTLKGTLLVRVGKEGHGEAVTLPGASTFTMGDRQMQGFISVAAEALKTDRALNAWIERALAFVNTLPPKEAKAAKKRAKRGAPDASSQ
jgi:TfoX/Sxy family transcriptional regulator of competence genes